MHLSYELFPWCHKSISKCFRGFLLCFFFSLHLLPLTNNQIFLCMIKREKRIQLNWKTMDLNETIYFLSFLLLMFCLLWFFHFCCFRSFFFPHGLCFILTIAFFAKRNFFDQRLNHISINWQIIWLLCLAIYWAFRATNGKIRSKILFINRIRLVWKRSKILFGSCLVYKTELQSNRFSLNADLNFRYVHVHCTLIGTIKWIGCFNIANMLKSIMYYVCVSLPNVFLVRFNYFKPSIDTISTQYSVALM